MTHTFLVYFPDNLSNPLFHPQRVTSVKLIFHHTHLIWYCILVVLFIITICVPEVGSVRSVMKVEELFSPSVQSELFTAEIRIDLESMQLIVHSVECS